MPSKKIKTRAHIIVQKCAHGSRGFRDSERQVCTWGAKIQTLKQTKSFMRWSTNFICREKIALNPTQDNFLDGYLQPSAASCTSAKTS